LCKPNDGRSRVFEYAGTSIVLSVLTLTTIFGFVYASSNDDRGGGNSIVGSYADGYELGKENGSDDYRSGNNHNSKCPPNDSLTWFGGYKIGYEVGWAAAKALGD
jgi:hypothetical protein